MSDSNRQSSSIYKGKNIYVGIDVHKKTYHFTAICEGLVVKKATVKAIPDEFCKSLKKWFKGARSIKTTYEAGFCGFHPHRYFEAAGFDNIIVNPASIEVAANNKVKTDPKDSKKLAEQRYHGRLRAVRVPDVESEHIRLYTRTREQTVKLRSDVSRKIKSKMHLFGLMDPEDSRPMSRRYISELWQKTKDMPHVEFNLRVLCSQWESLTDQIKEIDQKLNHVISEDKNLAEMVEIIKSVPGIGEVGSRSFALELGRVCQRFTNKDHLYSYLGLTPSEHSSGEKVRRGHISRQGSARIRRQLVESAWIAVKKDPALAAFFDNIAGRRGKKIAIVAVARKLAGCVRACIRDKAKYRIIHNTQGGEQDLKD